MFTLTFRYTPSLLRRYYFGELWRRHGGYVLSVPLALAIAVWASLNPEYLWFGGFLAGVALVYVVSLLSAYQQMKKQLDGISVTATVSEAGFKVRRRLGDICRAVVTDPIRPKDPARARPNASRPGTTDLNPC